MLRLDVLLATAIVALAGLAVWLQVGADPLAPYEDALVRPLALGESFTGDITLEDIGGEKRTLYDWFGDRATVYYAWSTVCPCIPACEDEMRALQARFGKQEGVTWIGVAGEPTDTREAVLETMVAIKAGYRMVLDPSQRLCRRLGFDRAALIAVFDGDGRLRYRGTLNDDLKEPTRHHLAEVLEALFAGRPLPLEETPPAYGCEFSAPPELCEDDVPPRPRD